MNRKIELKGHVFSGIGEGKIYVTKNPYHSLFRALLEGAPFLGTLNVILEKPWYLLFSFPHVYRPRGFGAIRYTLGYIDDVGKIVVLRPDKTRHPDDVVEIVSRYNLRELLGLKDGSIMKFYIYVDR
ncbi:MAG: DUF120 domain-containing protein [Candidatus Njordarchaeales archaeon]